ncbi:tyrosine-type recombinase/integrase [Anaerophilus nitritogenes]|uniref:tyrosine-type recombinase/integrase n=1 Tax=Anaerophilus nitritogenes TaxID=2498136 RepID=UPI00101CB601|nr:tyrosine-type recombinase/integrase [Anaerophilus nitritogenes]
MEKFITSFKMSLRKKRREKNTIESYVRDIRQFLNYIDKPVVEIEENDVLDFIEYLESEEQGLSPKTVNRKITSINAFVLHLNEGYQIQIHIKIPHIKIYQKGYTDYQFSQIDFKKMVIVAKKQKDFRAVAIFYTLLYLGLRITEMLQLEISDTKKEVISIQGKGKIWREVIVTDLMRKVWDDYLKHRSKYKPKNQNINFKKDQNKLFIGKQGNLTRQAVYGIIRKYAIMAEVDTESSKPHKVTPHKFRHLCGKTLKDNNCPLTFIQRHLGHVSINTTTRYLNETVQDVQNTLENVFQTYECDLRSVK